MSVPEVSQPGVVVITGASSGIGLALACALATTGTALLLTARRGDRLGRIADRLRAAGCAVGTHACDVADQDQMQRAFDKARALGVIEAVVNNAGVLGPVAPIGSIAADDFDRHFRTNVLGVLIGIQLALRSREAGRPLRVVNVSSGASTRAFSGWAAYCSSKAAVNMLTQVAAREHDDGETSVIAVAPGIIETAMQRAIRGTDRAHFADVDRFVELKNTGQLLHPADAAVALAWLVLAAPRSLSGKLVDARDDEVQAAVAQWSRGREQGWAKARAWFDELEPLG